MAVAPPKVICLGFVLFVLVLLGLAEAVPVSRGRFLAEDGYKVVKNNEKTEEKNSSGEHEKTIKKEVERQKPGGQETEKYEKYEREKKEKEKQESEMKEKYEREKQEKEKKENYEKQMYEKEKKDKYQKEKMEKGRGEQYQKESGEKVSYEKYESESGEKSKYEKHEKESEENAKYEKHEKESGENAKYEKHANESGSKQNSESAQKEKYENEKREMEMKDKYEKEKEKYEREKYEKEQKEKYEKEKREKEEKENKEKHGKDDDDDTNGSSSTPAPYPPTSGRKRVRCRNKNYPQCYGQVHVCPSSCASTCEVDCATCKPVCSCDYPGAVCQDPRFIGGDGITFYFHGQKNKDFCIVSDTNLHINAHFIGKRNPNMGRDFTWVESLGILFNNHKLFIGARKTVTWDDSIDRLALNLDGEPIFLDEAEGFTWRSTTTPTVSVTRIGNTNSVALDIQGILKITTKVVPITEEDSRVHHYGITKDDCFAHLDLAFKFYSLGRKVEGVLGRTYRDDYVSNVKMGIAMPVVGGEAEYETSSLFETDCSVARFEGTQLTKDEGSLMDLSSLSCASGMGEAGVICKR